jgi:tetratricopeptide (TPR) repeat protein
VLLRRPVQGEQLVRLTWLPRLLLGALLVTASAQAAPKRPAAPAYDQKQEKAARAHFERAEKAFNLGHFDAALTSYQAAYEALPLPAFLFNIAQCHRNLRNREQAVFFYQRYLSLAPEAPNRPVVEELIAEQKRLVEYEQPVEPPEEGKRVDLTARPDTAPDGTVAHLADKPAEESRSKWKKARWYLLGALGAALIGGVALLSVRRSPSLPTGQLGAIDTR